ncbi:MAG: hypothetical protein ACXWLE_03925 [Rhizomicrobium sp.]
MKPRTRTRKAIRLVLPRLLMFVTLLAFSVQTYLTQTHIHMASEGHTLTALERAIDGSAKAIGSAPVVPKDKYPPNEDPANCPLCQELIHAGQFVTPAAAAILLPSLSISVIEVVAFAAPLNAAVTHIWRGRAPPRR